MLASAHSRGRVRGRGAPLSKKVLLRRRLRAPASRSQLQSTPRAPDEARRERVGWRRSVLQQYTTGTMGGRVGGRATQGEGRTRAPGTGGPRAAHLHSSQAASPRCPTTIAQASPSDLRTAAHGGEGMSKDGSRRVGRRGRAGKAWEGQRGLSGARAGQITFWARPATAGG